ncbi:MAG: hypothetical protein WAR77_01630 [Saprospiraceae bacterium]
MRNLNYIGFISMLIFLSCDAKEDCLHDLKAVVKIRWTGDYAVDGCGYFIDIQNIGYKPINEDYIKNTYSILQDTIVHMRYFDLKNSKLVMCGFVQAKIYPTLEVLDIYK